MERLGLGHGWQRFVWYWKRWRPVTKIGEGEMLMPLHGLVYRDWKTAGAVTALMPFNIVWAWGRRLMIWMRFESIPKICGMEIVRRDAYAAGHRAGMILERERTGSVNTQSYRR